MDINNNQGHLMYSFVRPSGEGPKINPNPKDTPDIGPMLMYSFVRPGDDGPIFNPDKKPDHDVLLMYSYVGPGKKPENKPEEPFAPLKPRHKFHSLRELIEKFLEKFRKDKAAE